MINFEGINPDDNHHPEIDEDPLAMEHPSQKSLRALHSGIKKKVEGRPWIDGQRGNDLRRAPDDIYGAATVIVYERGALKAEPNCIAHITRTDVTSEDDSMKIITNWKMFDTPDGLQIHKHTHTQEIHDFGSRSIEESLVLISALKDQLNDRINAVKQEDQTGLSFVSESEVRQLSDFIHSLNRL